MRSALLVSALALAGCIGGGAPGPLAPTGPVVPIRLDAGGIEPVGTGLRIDFGRAQPGVLDTVGRLRDDRPAPVACAAPGVTATAFGDLTLVFRDGAFRGWQTSDAALSATGVLSAGAAC